MRRGKWLKEGERGFKDGNQGGGRGGDFADIGVCSYCIAVC